MLDTMLNGEHSGTAINALCPEDWTDMLLPGVMDTMTTPNSTLLDLAAQNDVHNWTPAMPLHMRYCTDDERCGSKMQSVPTNGCLQRALPMWRRSIWVDSITMAVRCRRSQQVFSGLCHWNRAHPTSRST